MSCAPVALFVYNRLDHTRQTVDSLRLNSEAASTKLYIFSVAAKNSNASSDVTDIRSYISTIKGFQSVTIILRDKNLGLANSIIDGVTRLCGEYGQAIILEDDLVTSPYFLRFMNDALDLYRNDDRVSSVSGYMYPIELPISEETFFCKAPHSWGWATWKSSWDLFNSDGCALLEKINNAKLTQEFEKNGPYSYLKMLKQQISGKNNSWYIRWYASCFLSEKWTLMSSRSLVKNIGIDGTGVHCASWKYDPFMGDTAQNPVKVDPISVLEREDVLNVFRKYNKKVERLRFVNFAHRLIGRLRGIYD